MNEQNNFQAPQPPVNNGKAFSIVGLVCGIVGIVFAWWGTISYAALACAIVGIVMAVMGRKKSLAANGTTSGLATAGLVCSIIGTVLAGIGVIVCTIILGAASSVGLL